MIRYLSTLVLFMHGIGHTLFMANTWGYWRTTSGRAWLLSDVLHLSQPLQGMVGLLWIVPLVGFVAATGAFCTIHEQAPWPSYRRSSPAS